MCIYLCVRAFMCVHVYAYMHAHVRWHAPTHMHTYTPKHIHIHKYTSTGIFKYIFTCVYTCMRVHLHICMHMHMRAVMMLLRSERSPEFAGQERICKRAETKCTRSVRRPKPQACGSDAAIARSPRRRRWRHRQPPCRSRRQPIVQAGDVGGAREADVGGWSLARLCSNSVTSVALQVWGATPSPQTWQTSTAAKSFRHFCRPARRHVVVQDLAMLSYVDRSIPIQCWLVSNAPEPRCVPRRPHARAQPPPTDLVKAQPIDC